MADMDLITQTKDLLASGKLTEYESGRVSILGNAVQKNLKAYMADPTAAAKRNLDASEAGLKSFTDELRLKYAPPAGPAFKNRMAVVAHLQDRKFKVKKSKVYNDAAAGILRMEADGTITQTSVEKYIADPRSGLESHQEQVHAGRDVDIKDLARQKLEAALDKERLQAEKLRFDLERERGLWLPLADFEMELAARASVLDQEFHSMAQLSVSDWVNLVAGKQSLAPQLRDALSDTWNKMVTRYVNTRQFQVMVRKAED